MADDLTVTIDAAGETDELTLPNELLSMFAEEDETPPETIGDVAMIGFAQQIHGAVHHGRGDPSEELLAIEEATMDAFEDRFDQTFAEMTGHDH